MTNWRGKRVRGMVKRNGMEVREVLRWREGQQGGNG
jgi:hypothetical protein